MVQHGASLKLIKVARLIDGNGGPPLEQAAILVEDDRIRAVGPASELTPPDGAVVDVFDYKRAMALPGLIDCHVHTIGIGDGRAGDELTLLPDEALAIQASQNVRAHLYSGVTTLRDCGAKNETTFMLRQAVEMGITPAPRLLLAGRPMSIIGGHLSYFGIEATGPNECRAAVRQLLKEGADFIKITATGGSTRTSYPLRPSFTVEELSAICDETHKFGKHAITHCTSSQGMINALDAGVDTIFHAAFTEADGSSRYRPEITERIANQGVYVNPTMHNIRSLIWHMEEKKEAEGLSESEQAGLDQWKESYEFKLECFANLRESGVTIVAGSDASWTVYQLGGFQHEIQAHVEAGMSPMEAIKSATIDAARSCWIDDRVGTLEAGKQADILIVKGDPSQDIDALWNIEDVFQDGRRVDRGNYV